jgi:hypothetical protein
MKAEDILLVIPHNWGAAEMTLADWIKTGPGPRPLLQPTEARDRATGAKLRLSVIPLRYRNSKLSRWLVRLGLVPEPWPRSP